MSPEILLVIVPGAPADRGSPTGLSLREPVCAQPATKATQHRLEETAFRYLHVSIHDFVVDDNLSAAGETTQSMS